MRSFFKCSFVIGAFVLTCGSSLGQRYHDGYTRPYKEMEAELKPSTLSEKTLIELLDDSRFYAREVATKELIQRGTKHGRAVIICMNTGSLEAQHRAETIMQSIAWDLLQKEKDSFKIDIKVRSTEPRYWSGMNEHLGGAFDRSFDSTIELTTAYRLERMTSPVTVKKAKTDSGEVIRAQVWKQNSCMDKTVSLFLNRPNTDFNFVTAEVTIKGYFEASDKVVVSVEDRKKIVRPDITWIDVFKNFDETSKTEFLLVRATDLMGRLQSCEDPQLLNKDGAAIVATTTSNRCAFQRIWKFPINKESSQAVKIQLKINGPVLPFEQNHNILVRNPSGNKG